MQDHSFVYNRKPQSPCQKCEDRKVGCHSKCKSYIAWKSEVDATSNKIHEERAKDYFVWKRYVRDKNAHQRSFLK